MSLELAPIALLTRMPPPTFLLCLSADWAGLLSDIGMVSGGLLFTSSWFLAAVCC